jgi:hypothetical protein
MADVPDKNFQADKKLYPLDPDNPRLLPTARTRW